MEFSYTSWTEKANPGYPIWGVATYIWTRCDVSGAEAIVEVHYDES